LKPGARSVEGSDDVVVAPCDGRLTEFGILDHDRMVQAKGLLYSAPALLGENSADVAALINGSFATIYLAPHDYHRVHMPVAGRLVRTRYIPGQRFSVNGATAEAIPGLFCRNERVVCWLDAALGRIAVVLVGALNVSSISTVTRGEIAAGPAREWLEPAPVTLQQGAELGRFNLGSTVILIFPPAVIEFSPSLRPGASLRMGTALARTAGHGAG
jgi:phosphatidylserine decarboxylase